MAKVTRFPAILILISSLMLTVRAEELCRTMFGYEYFIQNIPENTPIGNNIGHVNINGTDEQISLQQDDNEYFRFNSTTRNITLVKELDTDRNASDIPVLSLSCTILTSADSRAISITIRVIVNDWNDNPPTFNNQHHRTNVSEDAEIGKTVYTNAVATDNDKEYTGNSRITYQIVDDDIFSDYFLIPNPTKPIITLKRELDYESYQLMVVKIVARDNPLDEKTTGQSRSSTATLTVNILDADDQNPRFSGNSYRGTIDEDAQVGTVVNVTPMLYAEDPDTMNVSMQYRLLDSSNIFEINNVTAIITTKSILLGDLQTVTVVVLASQVVNTFREMFAVLTITINAANINAPRFSQLIYEVEKLELEPIGSVLVTTTATDIDFGTLIKYSLLEDIDDMTVDETGRLILQRALDYEVRQQWILHVTASDESHTATATVIITVRDVNDNSPVFDPVQSDILIAREQGRLVTIVTATDSDVNDIISFSLQNHKNLFSINDEGEIYVTAVEDQLVKEEYIIHVSASDNGEPPRKDSTIVTVKFPPLGFTLPPATTTSNVRLAVAGPETDNMITIVLGALAGLLLIVIVILVIVLIIRQRRMKEALSKAREPKGYAAKGLTYRQAECPDDLPKMDLHYTESTDGASEYDGATTIQDNPLNDQGVNEGYLQSSVSDEMDREMNEIEIETAVVPYDDDFGYPSGRSKYSGQLRTFQGDDSTSSGSAQSDSTGGSRRVLVNDENKKGGSKLTSWDSDDKIHPQGSEKLLEQGLPNKQKGDKPEITVYF